VAPDRFLVLAAFVGVAALIKKTGKRSRNEFEIIETIMA
jgi:hypothetical protein